MKTTGLHCITFVTGSEDKFREASSVISDLRRAAVDLPEIQSLDPNEVITAKLEAAGKILSGPVVVEDTSLTFEALKRLPGTYIRSFLECLKPAGLADLARRLDNNRASARTVLGCRTLNGKVHFVSGEVQGIIVAPRGRGFGWDAVFQPDGCNQTFGEMDSTQKRLFSMRAIAFLELKQLLERSYSEDL